MNIERIASSKPVNDIMADLIESKVLSILVDENISSDNLNNILKALYIYICRADYEIMLYMVKDGSEPKVLETATEMSLMSSIKYIDGDDDQKMLSYLLACDMMITDKESSDLLSLSRKLYLPRIVIKENGSLKFEDGILKLNSDPVDICSAFVLVKDKAHRDELSGHRRLV
ncbi:MAG: hypothetical protein K6G47_05595 [Clostridia bacterium]|nr:hypothetical protein [Clostridia bacterium]